MIVRIWFIGWPEPQEVRLRTKLTPYVHNGQDGWTRLMLSDGRKMRALQKYHALAELWEVV
jgi:hypothetical protein